MPHLNTLISFCLIIIDATIWSHSHVTTGITHFYSATLPCDICKYFIVFVNLYDQTPLSITCAYFILLNFIVIVHLYDHTPDL